MVFPQNQFVMAGLVPAIHVLLACKVRKTWMPGPRPGMTKNIKIRASAKAALRDWQDTIAGRALCNPAEACHIAACRSMS
jgi:hypothetical protein